MGQKRGAKKKVKKIQKPYCIETEHMIQYAPLTRKRFAPCDPKRKGKPKRTATRKERDDDP